MSYTKQNIKLTHLFHSMEGENGNNWSPHITASIVIKQQVV